VLKILQISNKAPFPANDGSSIAIYNMARGLIGNGVELHLLCINTKKHFKPDGGVPTDFRMKSNYISVYRNTNISVAGALLNLFTGRSYFVSRFYFGAFARRLAVILSEQQFDIVQLEGLFMGVYINVIRKHSSARIVLRAHNIEHYIWKRHIANEHSLLKKMYLSLQNKRLKRFELDVFNKVDAVVPIAETDAGEIISLGCRKPVYANITGVDIEKYQSTGNITEKAGTVFYFGSMDWLPNQEAVRWFLHNCWDEINRKVPAARLTIAGRGMPLEFFHITRPNVSIVENVENGDDFFRQQQIMIVPLLSGSGLRIKIIEGMAYGKAIVSTPVGAEGIRCTHNENILLAASGPDFAAAVIRLLTSEDDRKRISANAASFAAAEFDNSKVVSGLVNFYNQLVNA
jgi:glycosyltransferase involved in cell wall biosynthesis